MLLPWPYFVICNKRIEPNFWIRPHALHLQEFFECETVASVASGGHSRVTSTDLTNFPITGGSLPAGSLSDHHQAALEAAVAGGLSFMGRTASTGGELRKSNSSRSIAASPEISATSLVGPPRRAEGAEAAAPATWIGTEGKRVGR